MALIPLSLSQKIIRTLERNQSVNRRALLLFGDQKEDSYNVIISNFDFVFCCTNTLVTIFEYHI